MNVISVDVEDWFHVKNLRKVFNTGIWDSTELRIEKNINLILESLEAENTNATFFVLGWVAKKIPGIIRKIASNGHEIASHGYLHGDYRIMSTNDIKSDILRGKETIENISGEGVIGFRAPNFFISDRIIDILEEAGFKYDSSLFLNSFNLNYGKLGDHNSSTGFFKLRSNLYEFPLSYLNFAGIKIPWAGGFYFRFIPYPIYRYGVNKILKDSNSFVFYIHPWEFDILQPRINEVSFVKRFKHYYNIKSTHSNFTKLLKVSNFQSFSKILELNIQVNL